MKGLRSRQSANANQRANGEEPLPGCGRGTGVKRHMRYASRVKIEDQDQERRDKYLNSFARKRATA
jgi:hypothetical protein